MEWRAWCMLSISIVLVGLSQAQHSREGRERNNSDVQRPEAIGGKYYSKGECVRIARWVIHDEKNLKSLTGIEVGNFWYTLDNCGFIYFNDQSALSERPSDEQIDVQIAIDWATHEYIARLVGVIDRLSATAKNEALRDLSTVAKPTTSTSLLPTSPASVEPPELWRKRISQSSDQLSPLPPNKKP